MGHDRRAARREATAHAPPRTPAPSPSHPTGPDDRELLRLQRTVGNAGVAALVSRTQRDAPPPPPTDPAARGHSAPRGRTPPGRPFDGPVTIQRFEAAHHEHVERGALTGPTDAGPGFSDQEVTDTYFGNWSRDFSQAFSNNPIVGVLGRELLFEVLNALAMMKFGRQLDEADFGIYSPREHIDNPAGQINADLLTGTPLRPQPGGPDEDISSEAAIDELFTVNEAGLPAYLGRSMQYIEEELSTAADLGRNREGLMHLGNGLHTVEDLFAHSNWIEIALGRMWQDNELHQYLDPQLQQELSQRDGEVVETFTPRTSEGRPILTTGTFTTTDTLISLGEALSAFLYEFDPFSASNPARTQATMEMILGRYQEQAGEGTAGPLVARAVGNIGQALGPRLAQQAERAVAGEQPDEDASLFDRAISGARGLAGAAVGAGVGALGGIASSDLAEWVVSTATNRFGQLPLVEAYRFTIKANNRVDAFFTDLDRRLQRVPGYPAIKAWLEQQKDAMREALKPPITAAVRFVGELVQGAFSEMTVQSTNIEEQIRGLLNRRALDVYDATAPENRAALLGNPEFMQLAAFSDEQLERFRAMVSTPEYVRAGPSHSQIAKDHADSPFFGTAAALAMEANRLIRDRLVAVWDAEGNNTPYGQDIAATLPPALVRRLPPPTTPESDWTRDQRRAMEEAAELSPQFRDLARRREGEYLAEHGAFPEAEEHHGVDAAQAALVSGLRGAGTTAQQLPRTLHAVADRVASAAPDAARELRRLAARIPAGMEGLADEVEHLHDSQELRQMAERLRVLAREKEGLIAEVQRVLRSVAERVEAADPGLDDAADRLRGAADVAAPTLRSVGRALRGAAEQVASSIPESMAGERQMSMLAGARERGQATGEWSGELSASHGRGAGGGAISPERQALFDEVRRLMSHPYDSDWWRNTMTEWAGSNRERLSEYIRSRNAGRMHHRHGH